MAIQRTNPKHALKAGTEAWFLPLKDGSYWTQKLDWLLNFQIRLIQSKNTMQLSPELKALLLEQEIEVPAPSAKKNGLLIASQDYLPTQHVVVLNTENLKSFLEHIAEYSQMLNLESIRVFLPPQVSLHDFISHWKYPSPSKVSIVEDIQP